MNGALLMQSRSDICTRARFRVTRSPTRVNVRRHLAPLRALEGEAIDPSALAGVLGYVSGAGFFALWFLEQKSKSNVGEYRSDIKCM